MISVGAAVRDRVSCLPCDIFKGRLLACESAEVLLAWCNCTTRAEHYPSGTDVSQIVVVSGVPPRECTCHKLYTGWLNVDVRVLGLSNVARPLRVSDGCGKDERKIRSTDTYRRFV